MKTFIHILAATFLFSACDGASTNKADEVILSVDESNQSEPVVLSVTEFKEKLEIPDVQLIDVRTDGEVAEGMIANATQMDISDWDSFVESTSKLDKTKPVLVYCKVGGRSAKAAEYLSDQGYQVYDLKGGYDAWTRKH
jgi:rhodanese-related sulfurtransferase